MTPDELAYWIGVSIVAIGFGFAIFLLLDAWWTTRKYHRIPKKFRKPRW